MFLVGTLSWWYGAGLRKRIGMEKERMLRFADYFSIGLLLRTLFAPFRQISAGKVQGALGLQIRAFFDRLISRVIGAIVRTMTALVGLVVMAVLAVSAVVLLAGWLVLPIFPVIGLLLFAIGWVPWSL